MLKQMNFRIMLTSIIIFIITIVARIWFEFNLIPAIVGCLVGLILAVLKLKLLKNTIETTVEMDVEMAKKKAMFDYVSRYTLTAVVLVFSVFYSLECFVTTVLVLILGTKVAVYSIKLEDKIEKGGK